MKRSLLAFAILALSTVSHLAFAYGDLCNTQYNGTWGFRGGRSMSIAVYPVGGNRVSVTVSQQNGSETLGGTCVYTRNGAILRFSGGVNNGQLNIYNNGQAQGSVAGYSFNGYAY